MTSKTYPHCNIAYSLFIFIISKDVLKHIKRHVVRVIKGEVQSQAVAKNIR